MNLFILNFKFKRSLSCELVKCDIKGSEITLRDRGNKFQPQIATLPTYHLTDRKNNHRWLGAIILALCLIGLGVGSIFLPNNVNQQNTENIENIEH